MQGNSRFKYKICYFLFNLFIILAAYGLLLHYHYSVDSYVTMHNSSLAPLKSGRYLWYAIAVLLDKLKINTVFWQIPLIFIFMSVMAYCAARLTIAICHIYPQSNEIDFVAVDIIVLLGFVNTFIQEWFLYPESVLYYAIGFLAMTEGTIAIVNRKYLWAFTLVLCSVFCYQILLPVFVIYSLFFAVLSNNEKNKWILYLKVILCGGCAGGVAAICQHMVNNVISSYFEINVRGTAFAMNHLAGAAEVAKLLFVNGNGTLPENMILVISVITTFFIIKALVKNRNISILSFLFVVAVQFGIIFVPQIVSTEPWYPPRSLVGFFTFLSVMMLFGYLWTKGKTRYIISTLSVVLILTSVYFIQAISIDNYKLNAMEQKTCTEIQAYIDNYEQKSGKKITQIACYQDSFTGFWEVGLHYVWYDTNTRQLPVTWARINMLNYYSGRIYQETDAKQAIYNKYFADKDWDYFAPDEQLVFKENTLHWCIY